MNKKWNEKINFLFNYPTPTPLNLYIKFELCSKQAADSEYKIQLKQVIECDPNSKKLLELEKKIGFEPL